MFKWCHFLLFLGFTVHICVSAPITFDSRELDSISSLGIDDKADIDRLTIEIKTSLDNLVQSSSTDKFKDKGLSRSVNEAVIILQQVLKQALQNTNPILSKAVVSSLVQLDQDYDENEVISISKLTSFLDNLKIQVTLANFPPNFSTWLNNHILVIQNYIRETIPIPSTKASLIPDPQENEIMDDEGIKEKVEQFKLFIQDGLESLVRQDKLNTMRVNNLLESQEFEKAISSMIMHHDQDENEQNTEYPEESSHENYSTNFVQALKQVYKHATPDLQPIILRTLEKIGIVHERGSPTLRRTKIR